MFGGTLTTAADVAVAAGLVKAGFPDVVKGLDGKYIRSVLIRVTEMLEHVIDTVMTSPAPMPVFWLAGAPC